jgi:aminopeptidase N
MVVRECFASRQIWLTHCTGHTQLLENNTEGMYELPKMDQVAVPNLHYLAMENWGIFTEN